MEKELNVPVCKIEVVDEEKVSQAREKLVNMEAILNIADTFKLLGESTRLKIILSLIDSELCVCDISASTDSSISAVSHQLRLLRNARLVKYRKEGKMVYYSLDDDHVYKITKEAINHYAEHR